MTPAFIHELKVTYRLLRSQVYSLISTTECDWACVEIAFMEKGVGSSANASKL